MKRFITFLLAAIFLLNFTGCQESHNEPVNSTGSTAASTETTQDSQETSEEETESTESTPPEPGTPTEPAAEEFVRVVDYIPTVKQALAYASEDNFTGYRIYDFKDAYLRYGTVKKLTGVSAELAEWGFGLIIWDAFRPVSAQETLWNIFPNSSYMSHPVTGSRSHSRGNTVDVALYDLETGKELPIPSKYDDFSALADRNYNDCSPESAANAQLLEDVMKKCGFVPYQQKWWHFSDTVDYPVDTTFDPGIHNAWSASCNEYMSLWEYPGGKTIAKIPRNAAMELLSWAGKYSFVAYGELKGYVLSSYIMPQETGYFNHRLNIVKPTNLYSYEQMLSDMESMQARYPKAVFLDSIGNSELGREIPVMRLGNPEADHHVLLQGAIHGREHMTAWLLMAMTDYWLSHGILAYENICYHIIPMSNPDGVIISQTGVLTEEQQNIYHSDTQKGYTSAYMTDYAPLWKANGKGVDINRNFPTGWDKIDKIDAPSSEMFQGEAPFSSAEAAALRDYTLSYDFDVTISYHSTGSLIYYGYDDKEPVNKASETLAKAVRDISGYDLAGSIGVVGAGYKDWVIDELEIPSLTIEIGCEDSPLAERELYSIFARNYRLLPTIFRYLAA